jgi:hypothetical protein
MQILNREPRETCNKCRYITTNAFDSKAKQYNQIHNQRAKSLRSNLAFSNLLTTSSIAYIVIFFTCYQRNNNQKKINKIAIRNY